MYIYLFILFFFFFQFPFYLELFLTHEAVRLLKCTKRVRLQCISVFVAQQYNFVFYVGDFSIPFYPAPPKNGAQGSGPELLKIGVDSVRLLNVYKLYVLCFFSL